MIDWCLIACALLIIAVIVINEVVQAIESREYWLRQEYFASREYWARISDIGGLELASRQERDGHNREAGRIRPVVLVLLIGLAALAWYLRDVLWLIWMMFTQGVGH